MNTCTLADAASACGYRRKATFREKFLQSEEDRASLGAHYDAMGRLLLDADAVDRLAREVELERESRGNWRIRNLGRWAIKRGRQPTHPEHEDYESTAP